MNSIEIKGLTRKFKNRKAVNSLELSISEGEMFALLGQNGAGKSTTIKMLSCLLIPTQGDAYMLGKSIKNDYEEVKKFINASPQETAVAPKLTVKENLELIARIYGSDKKEATEQAKKMMKDFQLADRANDKAKSLSGGMQRRLSIAMALISNPKILFLDEPTLGLDVRARRDLWEIIAGLKGKITIILTTHYLEEAENLADRIAIMNNGELKVMGTVDEILEKTKAPNFEEAFLSLTDKEEE